MQKISVIDLVYNHTITLECELKVVSRMLSMKRPTAVFARTAVTIFKNRFHWRQRGSQCEIDGFSKRTEGM